MQPAWILVVTGCLLIALVPPSNQVQYCSSNSAEMEVWGEECYVFPSGIASFSDAESRCADEYNATLASIHSEKENTFIHDKIYPIAYYNYWIGMKKNNTVNTPLEANYYWLDGTPNDYTNWASGEPNDFDGIENCVEAYLYRSTIVKKWNDINCLVYHNFVCKAPLVKGWQEFSGNQYYISNTADEIDVTWYEARDWCMQRGGDLASILTDEERAQVVTWASKNTYKGNLWTGLNKLAGERDSWRWSEGSAYSWTNWKTGFPKDDEFANLCGCQASDDKDGKWMNSHCDTKKGFICKRLRTSSPTPKITQPTQGVPGFCPAGYTGHGNKCFKVVMSGQMGEGALTFEEATLKCREEPGVLPSLASIHSDLEQAYVSSQLQAHRLAVWIGLKRLTSDDDWTWVDSSPFQYYNWAPGKPKASTESDCTEVLMRTGTVGQWNNTKCADKRGYVCQTYKDSKHVIKTTATPSMNFTCPSEFIPYWYGCFRYISDKLPYVSSKARCKGMHPDGKLVGIHSEPENAAIQTVSMSHNEDLWIGLKAQEGEYEWEDSWWVFFVNWARGQPVTDAGGGCVYMSPNGKWSDSNCNVLKQSVCKISKIDPITTPATIRGSCPPGQGWLEYNEHCYLFVTGSRVSWKFAKRNCQGKSDKSTIASIHSFSENRMIYNHLVRLGVGSESIWLGLYRSEIDKSRLKWTDGSGLQYAAWAPGAPGDGAGSLMDCVQMYNAKWPHLWEVRNCNEYKSYVCKAPKTPLVSDPTPSPHCDPGWKHSTDTGVCYYFQPDNIRPLEVARQICQDMSAEIVSIHGIFENRFFEVEMKAAAKLPLVTANFWIGLRAQNSEQTQDSRFTWTDNSELDYENWSLGEPRNYKFSPCVFAYGITGKWVTSKCHPMHGFACKKASKTQQSDTGALAGGQVAGVVIGVLLGVALLSFLVVAILTHKQVIDNPIQRFMHRDSGLIETAAFEKT